MQEKIKVKCEIQENAGIFSVSLLRFTATSTAPHRLIGTQRILY